MSDDYVSLPKRLESFAEKNVPGLRVYLKREGIRDADKIIRDELVKRMDDVISVLDKAKKRRVDQGSIKNLDKLDRATRKIEKVRNTIRFDSRGYQGIFDPQEVTEKDLMALLDFDQKMFGIIDSLEREAKKVAGLPDPELLDALSSFEEQVEGIDRTLSEREKYTTQTPSAAPAPRPRDIK